MNRCKSCGDTKYLLYNTDSSEVICLSCHDMLQDALERDSLRFMMSVNALMCARRPRIKPEDFMGFPVITDKLTVWEPPDA